MKLQTIEICGLSFIWFLTLVDFDFICNSTSIGIKDLNLSGKSPVIFCVLTDDNLQQSIDRSGGKYGNKGTEAAIAAIEMSLI